MKKNIIYANSISMFYVADEDEKMKLINKIFYLVIIILMTFLGTVNWFHNNWDRDSIDFATIIFQLRSPLKGTSPTLIINYVIYICSLVIVISIIVFIIDIILKISIIKLEHSSWDLKPFSNRELRICCNGVEYIYHYLYLGLLIVYLFNKSYVSLIELGFFDYIDSINNKSTIYENYYVQPSTVNIEFPEDKRNLIYIYMESMEVTYADRQSGGGKKINYIPRLTVLANENVNFSNNDKMGGLYCTYGARWTIAGLLASTSGISYKIPGDILDADKYAVFLPNITNLGDVLCENGYRNYFLCGSEASFSGRDIFFSSHGNYELHDYYYAVEKGYIPKDYYVYWGYEDKVLYDIAMRELSQIAQQEAPFNYTILTLDTHSCDGYICELCGNDYEEQFSNVISCADKQIANFIDWVQQQEWYDNTTIIIVGDHNSFTPGYWDDVEGYERQIYNCFINLPNNIDTSHIKYREISSLDLFPTALCALGVNIDGERLGLGTNAFSGEKTLIELYGKEYVDGELANYSQYYIDQFL